MNKIPLPELPWQAQLAFWVLMLLVGVLLGFSAWFLVRYIKGRDDIDKDNIEKFNAFNRKVEDLKATITNNSQMVMNEMHKIKDSALNVRQETLEDIAQIKNDVAESKALVKVVETHQTVLKTIVVKLNNLMIIKGEKPTKE